MLSWVVLIGPNVHAPDLLLSQRLVSIAYPLCDVLLLAVAARLWGTGGHGTVASRLLILGLGSLLVADTVYGLSLLAGGWDAGGPVDAFWIAFYLGVGLTALHPSMVSLSEPAPPTTRLTRTRLGLLAGASLMAPAVLVIQTVRQEPVDVGVVAGGSVVLFLLTLARMGGLASEVVMQTERKRVMQFDPAVASRLLSEGHFGLAGMRERVEMVGGHLSVHSTPGRGTTVAVEMESRAVEHVR
jgi:hypothetical protein